MKDYLGTYSKKVTKHQAGGPVADPNMDPNAAPVAQQGAPDIEGMIMAAYDSQDPNMALQAINAIVESMQGGQGQAAPMARKGMRLNTTQPMFRKGGKLI